MVRKFTRYVEREDLTIRVRTVNSHSTFLKVTALVNFPHYVVVSRNS